MAPQTQATAELAELTPEALRDLDFLFRWSSAGANKPAGVHRLRAGVEFGDFGSGAERYSCTVGRYPLVEDDGAVCSAVGPTRSDAVLEVARQVRELEQMRAAADLPVAA